MQYQPQASYGQTVPNLVKLYRHRSTCYKLGLICLCAALGLFLIGFSTSHWIKDVDSDKETWYGLWNIDCDRDLCNTSLLITQMFFVLYLGAYLISIAIAIYENARKLDPNLYHSRKLELILALTGIVGIGALATFSLLYSDSVQVSTGWSRTITGLSVGVLVMALVIFVCANNRPIRRAGQIISLNRPQTQQQAQQQILVQQAHQPMPPPPNPVYNAQMNSYPLVNAYQAPQYPAQSQPLLPQPQPYPPPTAPDAPPPYSMPPAYPGTAQVEYSYPTQSAQDPGISKASAPPME